MLGLLQVTLHMGKVRALGHLISMVIDLIWLLMVTRIQIYIRTTAIIQVKQQVQHGGWWT